MRAKDKLHPSPMKHTTSQIDDDASCKSLHPDVGVEAYVTSWCGYSTKMISELEGTCHKQIMCDSKDLSDSDKKECAKLQGFPHIKLTHSNGQQQESPGFRPLHALKKQVSNLVKEAGSAAEDAGKQAEKKEDDVKKAPQEAASEVCDEAKALRHLIHQLGQIADRVLPLSG